MVHIWWGKKTFEKIIQCFNCFEHAKGLLKHHQFASSFEKWNFISNGTLKGNSIQFNSIYYTPFVIFQRYKIIILNICFTSCGCFYCFCTLLDLIMLELKLDIYACICACNTKEGNICIWDVN